MADVFTDISVVKRDGSLQNYDPAKVITAVASACREANVTPQLIGIDVESRVCAQLAWKNNVEHIQDLVEKALMDLGHHEVARSYIVYREEHAKVRKVHPDPAAIGDYILMSKYAKFLPEIGRRENLWEEVALRNMHMHIRKYPQLESEIRAVYDAYVMPKKVLPSMRSLQFGGIALEKNNARMFNCSFSHCDRPRFFAELLYLLMSGCGCGYSVQARHMKKLPSLSKVSEEDVRYHVVQDTIEGWADALYELILSYMDPSRVGYVEYDYSLVRRKGEDLVTSGGKAPGHVPLKIMLENVRKILSGAQGRRLRPLEAHRVNCFVAEAVLAGGIRRSSLICLFDAFDAEMMNAKTGEWYNTMPELAMSNNSAVFLRTAEGNEDNFFSLFDRMQQFGEPGFFFTNNFDYGTNPCAEIGLDPVLEVDGAEVVGWSFCNLTEINGATVESREDFIERAKAASFLGTLQAGYTEFPYLGRTSEEIAKRDALLGVSITGVMDQDTVRDPETQKRAAHAVNEENVRVAQEIKIQAAARTTTIKPSGTASLLLGGVGAGHHEHHSRRYIRRVTANPMEPVFQSFKEVNPALCYEKPNGDWVVQFPMEAHPGAILRGDLTAVEFMKVVMSTFENWILPGTCRNDLNHNVSCTVTVKDDEWEDVAKFAWENRDKIGAMSFLPWIGDKVYDHAPREDMSDNLELWTSLCRKYKKVDYFISDGNTDYGGACEGPKCEIN